MDTMLKYYRCMNYFDDCVCRVKIQIDFVVLFLPSLKCLS